ncbi:hypothetical protein Hypma_005742 [Hypsizygus marmoreus]|uniref:Uncharacterized protein n=1 Tax=Hypsizygus marmoreus TaxID=39966 RepID=A0A369K805_HYPMA|nr:hypothetical protein Hypma_005742 [Hypsizygus marmoreus]
MMLSNWGLWLYLWAAVRSALQLVLILDLTFHRIDFSSHDIDRRHHNRLLVALRIAVRSASSLCLPANILPAVSMFQLMLMTPLLSRLTD